MRILNQLILFSIILYHYPAYANNPIIEEDTYQKIKSGIDIEPPKGLAKLCSNKINYCPKHNNQPAEIELGTETTAGNFIIPPKGMIELCKNNPNDCPIPKTQQGSRTIILTSHLFKQLLWVHQSVNQAIIPVNDWDLYNKADLWNPPPVTQGDCEDYVLAKRSKLIDLGWPEESLLIAVLRLPDTSFHAVLMIRTDRGDLVLDNRYNDLLPWDKKGYQWVGRQDAYDLRKWVRIKGSKPSHNSYLTKNTTKDGDMIETGSVFKKTQHQPTH